jgi:hypothetical protein
MAARRGRGGELYHTFTIRPFSRSALAAPAVNSDLCPTSDAAAPARIRSGLRYLKNRDPGFCSHN